MLLTTFFEKVKSNMSNRDAMIMNQQFLDRTQDAIEFTLGRTTSLKLITFREDGDIARTTDLGFNVLQHPELTNDTSAELMLEPLLIIAVKNKVCSEYEPMLGKKYMSNFWEAIGSYKEALANSREMAEIGRGRTRAFP